MPTPVPASRTRVFISYSHVDAEHLTRLHVHLAPYVRQGKVDVWDDTRIKPGMRWKEEIEAAIAQAKVAVLLVSADFLASEFIASDEVPPLLEAAEREGTLIVSVILSTSSFLRSKLARYQSLNSPADPLIDMPRGKQEAIWAKLAEYVTDALTPAASDGAMPARRAQPKSIRPGSREPARPEFVQAQVSPPRRRASEHPRTLLLLALVLALAAAGLVLYVTSSVH